MKSLDMIDVWKSYQLRNKEEVGVLKGIHLQVQQGEMIAIMGPSGSGKTTLLNMISGIDRADAGSIVIEGNDLSEMNRSELALFRRRRLGMVFQDYNLLESLSVKENVLLPMILDEKSEEEQENQADKLFKILGIEEIRNQAITEISGGQKQRVAIARALINQPALVLADEPTGNLDSKATREVMQYFKKINDEWKTSILMVTHDSFAANFCHKTVLLKEGNLFLMGGDRGDIL